MSAAIATRIISALSNHTVSVHNANQGTSSYRFEVEHKTGFEWGCSHIIEVNITSEGVYLNASCSGRTQQRRLRRDFSYSEIAAIIAGRAGDSRWTQRARLAGSKSGTTF